MTRRVLIAEDQSLMIRSVRSICRTASILSPTEVTSCRALLKTLAKEKYTHLILDLTLADGSTLPLLPRIFDLYPELKVMIYSMQPEQLHTETLWRRFGVQYVSKTESEPQTIEKILSFLEDMQPAAPIVDASQRNPFSSLAPREKDVLHHLLEGKSPKEIANALDISDGATRALKKRILDKTGAANVVELVKLAAYYLK